MHHRLKPLAALLPLLFAHHLHADEALSPVVVTATRFAAGQSAPIAAQVISADDIRESSALTVSEVLAKLGGVQTRINFTGVPDTPLDLRGFGMTGDQNTLVLVDGQRISENEGATARLSAIPVDAIERIEILRGSGAVLYGGGATGGTINIVTKSPLGQAPGGTVSALAGSYGLREVRAGGQVRGEVWGLRLNAQHYENDNYRQNNRAEQDAMSGELRFGDRRDFLAIGFNADEQKARLPGSRSEALLDSDPRGTTTPNDYLNSRSRLFSLRGEKRYGSVTLALDASQRSKDADMFSDSSWGTSLMRTQVDVTTVSPRLLWHAAWQGGGNLLTVGADWSDWKYRNDTRATGWLTSQDESGEQNNRALYVRNELNLSSGTRLSVGVRRENVEQTERERLLPRAETRSERNLTAHELALQQDVGGGFSVYGRLGRSFRVANIDENRCWSAPCPDLLKPQRSRDREIGTQWRGQRGSFRAGLFEMDVTDEIHYMNISPFLYGANVNLPPTRHRGLELEGKLFVGDSVDLAARYTHVEARFREGNFGGVDIAGNDVPQVPKDRLGVNLGWQASAATRLSLNVLYVGRQRYDNDQANRYREMPSYTVTDIKLSHQLGAWRLAAGINNLFDEKYYSYGIVNSSYSSFNAYPEIRRNGYVSAEYRF